MTNEEAIKILSNHEMIDIMWDKADEALNMAIDALEQKPILDKIREIVDEWQSDTWTDNLSYDCMIKIAELVEPQERSE